MRHGISVWQQGFAIVNALIFGKVILVGEALKVGKGLERRALVWAVLGKSPIFFVPPHHTGLSMRVNRMSLHNPKDYGDSSAVKKSLSNKGLLRRFLYRIFIFSFYASVFFSFISIEDRDANKQQSLLFPLSVAIFNGALSATLMLLFEYLDIGRWRERQPLIYPTLIEATFLTVVFMALNIIERAVTDLSLDRTVPPGAPDIGDTGLVGLASVAAIMFIASIPFFAFVNVASRLGADRLRALLFGISVKR
jgi:hypothetical protein